MSGAAAWKKKSFICLCSLKCHSSPLKPINWGYNGAKFLSVEPLMNASKPQLTLNNNEIFLLGENISFRSMGTDKQVNII